MLAEKRRQDRPVLDLTVSNPTAAGFYPHAGISGAFSALRDFTYDPDPFGLPAARAAVSDFYRELGHDVSIERIALTASTSEAYAILFKLLCDPGDEVLIPRPSYPLFEYLAALENVRTVAYDLKYDGSWFIDFGHLRERISHRSRAIIIVNPNNPSGSFLKSWEKQELVELALKYELPLISDEVFLNYEFGSEPQRVKTLVGEKAVLSFSLNGFSKATGMPQMKLAWMTLNGPESDQRAARQRLEVLLDTYLSVNTLVQLATAPLMAIGGQIRSELLTRATGNLRSVATFLKESPVHVLHTEGGWSVILRLPATLSEEAWISNLLDQKNVLLQPGFFFDMASEPFAVASLITNPNILEEGLSRVRDFALNHS